MGEIVSLCLFPSGASWLIFLGKYGILLWIGKDCNSKKGGDGYFIDSFKQNTSTMSTMEIRFHEREEKKIAEIVCEDMLIKNVQDALDLMVNPALGGARKIILQKKNIHPSFFILTSGLARDVLQKFVNYQVQMAVVGDFNEECEDEDVNSFIIESNRGKDFFFLGDTEIAVQVLFGC